MIDRVLRWCVPDHALQGLETTMIGYSYWSWRHHTHLYFTGYGGELCIPYPPMEA